LDIVGNWAGESEYMISWNLAADLPSDFAELMIDQGMKSFLIFPLKISNLVFAHIGFDNCDHQRIWTKPEIDLLKTISNLISFSFKREQIKGITSKMKRSTRSCGTLYPLAHLKFP